MIRIIETHIPRWSTVPIAAGPRLAGPAASLGTEEQLPSPTLASWAKSRRSVFLREQDREDAPRHGRISRIGRAPFELRVVAVDFPEDRLAGVLESEWQIMINEIGTADQRMLKTKKKQNKPKGNTSGLKCCKAGGPKAL